MALKKKTKLIIVCGLPGSGKTTLSKELSKRTKTVCLRKDSIKEALYDIFEMKTLEDSKSIGGKSVELLFNLSEEQLAQGINLIIEAPFNFSDDYKIFKHWQRKYDLDLYSIICSIDDKTRIARINSRQRHHAHHDAERGDFSMNTRCNYKNIPGIQINVATDKRVTTLVDKILDQLK